MSADLSVSAEPIFGRFAKRFLQTVQRGISGCIPVQRYRAEQYTHYGLSQASEEVMEAARRLAAIYHGTGKQVRHHGQGRPRGSPFRRRRQRAHSQSHFEKQLPYWVMRPQPPWTPKTAPDQEALKTLVKNKTLLIIARTGCPPCAGRIRYSCSRKAALLKEAMGN